MPELPEVETVRRGLTRARIRADVTGVWRSDKPLRIGAAWRQENVGALIGATPGPVRRRGKHLVWEFERGDERLGLLVHLGMSGRLTLEHAGALRLPHTHLVVDFADGQQLRFVDPRRFGGVRAASLPSLMGSPPLCDLGPEPLSRRFGPAWLEHSAGGSRRAVRDVLLDQSVVAGLGNIYVLEALFAAGVHPLVAARRLRPSAWVRVADAAKAVLRQAIRKGGTTFRDFRDANGRQGRNAGSLWVYGRAGKPCRRCGATLLGFVRGGRSGAYCPTDQPRYRGRIP